MEKAKLDPEHFRWAYDEMVEKDGFSRPFPQVLAAKHISVVDVHQKIDGHHDEHSPHQAQRVIALRLVHFAGEATRAFYT